MKIIFQPTADDETVASALEVVDPSEPDSSLVDIGQLIADAYMNFGSYMSTAKIEQLRLKHRLKVVQVGNCKKNYRIFLQLNFCFVFAVL